MAGMSSRPHRKSHDTAPTKTHAQFVALHRRSFPSQNSTCLRPLRQPPAQLIVYVPPVRPAAAHRDVGTRRQAQCVHRLHAGGHGRRARQGGVGLAAAWSEQAGHATSGHPAWPLVAPRVAHLHETFHRGRMLHLTPSAGLLRRRRRQTSGLSLLAGTIGVQVGMRLVEYVSTDSIVVPHHTCQAVPV